MIRLCKTSLKSYNYPDGRFNVVIGSQLIEKFLFKIAKQWIAGDTIDDALISAKNAYQLERHAIINKLGEYHTSKKTNQYNIERVSGNCKFF